MPPPPTRFEIKLFEVIVFEMNDFPPSNAIKGFNLKLLGSEVSLNGFEIQKILNYSYFARFVPSLVFKIDSKAVSVKLNVNPNPKGDLTKNFTNCMLDPDQMKYSPIRIRFYHYDNQTSLRKLLWHEDELQTNVNIFRKKHDFIFD